MTEEAFTITVADFMNFPPTFDAPFLDNTSFVKLRKESFLDRLKKFNPLNLITEASKRAAIKKAILEMDDLNGPGEVLIINSRKKGAQFISGLIRTSLFK